MGCPVFERAWVLERWFDAVEAQEFGDLRFAFVWTPGRDETGDIIARRAPDAEVIVADDHRGFGPEERMNQDRYGVLAEMRNRLLWLVRELRPEYFLSWDSDVLFRPGDVRGLWRGHGAVGALFDMTGADSLMRFPSAMRFEDFATGRGGRHYTAEEALSWRVPRRVDVIMAVKLMSRRCYGAVDYAWHPQGEDLAWNLRCAELGIERWLHPGVRGRHLHTPEIAAAGSSR